MLIQVKHSSQSLLEYIQGEELVSDFAECLADIFQAHLKDDRVTIPLFQVYDLLLCEDLFSLFSDTRLDAFLARLIPLLSKEMFKSRDPKKLMAGLKM